jgi:hypothetical protein
MMNEKYEKETMSDGERKIDKEDKKSDARNKVL